MSISVAWQLAAHLWKATIMIKNEISDEDQGKNILNELYKTSEEEAEAIFKQHRESNKSHLTIKSVVSDDLLETFKKGWIKLKNKEEEQSKGD